MHVLWQLALIMDSIYVQVIYRRLMMMWSAVWKRWLHTCRWFFSWHFQDVLWIPWGDLFGTIVWLCLIDLVPIPSDLNWIKHVQNETRWHWVRSHLQQLKQSHDVVGLPGVHYPQCQRASETRSWVALRGAEWKQKVSIAGKCWSMSCDYLKRIIQRYEETVNSCLFIPPNSKYILRKTKIMARSFLGLVFLGIVRIHSIVCCKSSVLLVRSCLMSLQIRDDCHIS